MELEGEVGDGGVLRLESHIQKIQFVNYPSDNMLQIHAGNYFRRFSDLFSFIHNFSKCGSESYILTSSILI